MAVSILRGIGLPDDEPSARAMGRTSRLVTFPRQAAALENPSESADLQKNLLMKARFRWESTGEDMEV
jgi:hypothetical protein